MMMMTKVIFLLYKGKGDADDDGSEDDHHTQFFVGGQRLLSFNTKCQYNIGGRVGGDFSSRLKFRDQNEFIGWLDDPTSDDIHAIVRLQSDGAFSGPIVLEGWLTE